VDALLRALIATGWINFACGAMLMSVASYQAVLPWPRAACIWPACFVDYEPGIPLSQCQMQSGTTAQQRSASTPNQTGQESDPRANSSRQNGYLKTARHTGCAPA